MLRRTFIAGAGASLAAACSGAKPIAPTSAETAYPPLGRILSVGSAKVHATDEGAGGPPVILIHGASGNVRDWTFSITGRLAERRRVIAMDRPGFGYSTREGGDAWRPSAQAAQLRAAARQMGAERPIVVGHSWGAAVALAWALDAPDDVSGVVAVSGAMMPWGGMASALASLGFGDVIVGYYNSRMTKTAAEGGVDRFISRAFRPQRPPVGYVDYVGAPLALRENTLAANGDDLANTHRAVSELSSRYADLAVPLEVMHGDADWLLGFDQHALGIARLAPDARVTRLSGVGHMAHHARPDMLETLIDRIAAEA